MRLPGGFVSAPPGILLMSTRHFCYCQQLPLSSSINYLDPPICHEGEETREGIWDIKDEVSAGKKMGAIRNAGLSSLWGEHSHRGSGPD